MSRPSLLRSRAVVALTRPTLRRRGWLREAVIPLPKLGLTRAFVELVAPRVTLVDRPTVPLVASRRWVTPTRTEVLSLRGPSVCEPSRRLVLDAAWLTLRLAAAVSVGSKPAPATLTASLAVSVVPAWIWRSKFFFSARPTASSRASGLPVGGT